MEGSDDGKGPNDVSCVVWALGEFFFFISVFFNTNDMFYL